MPEFRNACLQEYAKDALFESSPFSPNNKYLAAGATGGVGGAKEGLVATNRTGVWRRPNWPELGKMATTGRSTAWGALGGKSEVA